MTVIFPSFCFAVLGSSGKTKHKMVQSVTHESQHLSWWLTGATVWKWQRHQWPVTLSLFQGLSWCATSATTWRWQCRSVQFWDDDSGSWCCCCVCCSATPAAHLRLRKRLQISTLSGTVLMVLMVPVLWSSSRSPKTEKKAANQYSVRYCTHGSDGACALIKQPLT